MQSQKKVEAFFKILLNLKELSNCKVNKHTTIIIPRDFSSILAIGYNGPARGIDNNSCTGEDNSNCGCVHAEANALIKLRTEKSNLILLCTKSPCLYCTKLIINSGQIKVVAYKDTWSKVTTSRALFDEVGILSTSSFDLVALLDKGFIP